MDRGGSRANPFAVKGLRSVFFEKGQPVDGVSRVEKPAMDVQREFLGSRLEEQVMIQAYELVVPVIRMRMARTAISSDAGRAPDCETRSLRVA